MHTVSCFTGGMPFEVDGREIYLDTHKVHVVVENDEDSFLTDAFDQK
jgi:hypothetical protein